MPAVSIVIPNFNGAQVIPACLDCLTRQTFKDFDVILVDNGSVDNSLAVAREKWPGIKIISFEQNRGFAPAANAGIKASDSEFVALLNNDVQVEPDWLAHLVDALAADPQAFAVGPKLLLDPERHRINVVGIKLKPYLESASIGAGQVDQGQFDQPGQVFGVSAGAALYRRSVFYDVGYFDKDFFAYLEDVDLSFRGRLLGYHFRYEPLARAYHLKGWTTKGKLPGSFEIFHSTRNYMYYQVKNIPDAVWRAKRWKIIGRHLELFIRATVQHLHKGEAGPHLSGLLDYWRNRDRFRVRRKSIQQTKRISDEDLLFWLGKEVVPDEEIG